MKTLKKLVSKLLTFTTGLNLYGIGLLGVAAGLTLVFGWGTIPAAFIGAFVFKNFKSIIDHINKI